MEIRVTFRRERCQNWCQGMSKEGGTAWLSRIGVADETVGRG
jgi:hypothetical protein